jgi:exodeoxyribonuclease V beta subunit
MSKFNVLDPDMNVFGGYFLEASAGTGKTFAIEHIVPRLLLEAQEPISIDSILVVTFTRAATRELKARIYKNLLKIMEALEQKEGGPPYLEKIFQKGEEALYTAKQRVEEALFSFETAQIFTLHGFCLSILQEFAFDAEFFVKAQDEMDLIQSEGVRTYIKDFLRKGLDPDLMSPSQIRKVFSKKDLEGFLDAILRTLDKGQAIREGEGAKEQWKKWNSALMQLPRLPKEEIYKEFSLTAPRLVNSKKWEKQLGMLFSAVEKGELSFEKWDELLQDKELFLPLVKAPSLKNASKIAYPAFFEKMKDLLVPLHQEAVDGKALLLKLVHASQKHYEKGKKELFAFQPDDFVLSLKKALEKKEIRQKIGQKFKALIIDEFQDTDPDQWQIFSSLFLEENKLPILYLVGDPKQSIYGFRSADVYIYLQARSLFPESAQFYLGTNYRSHPDFVSALNHLFSYNLPESFLPLPLTNEFLSIRKVEAKDSFSPLLEDEKIGRIHFFVKEEEAGRSKRFPKEETEEDFLIPFIAQEVLRLKKEKEIPFSSVAVLVKDRFQAARLQKGFKGFGIPCQMQKDFSCKSTAYTAVKELLEVVLRPFDLSALKKVLGGVLVGFSSYELMEGIKSPTVQKGREYFTGALTTLQRKGFGAFFYDFLGSTFKEETVAEEILQREDPSLYFELRQLLQILLDKASFCLHDPNALLIFLEKMKVSSDKDLCKVPSEEEGEEVQVMTIHKSKGLEFEVVFALGLVSRHTGLDDFISIRKEEGSEVALSKEEEEAFNAHIQEVDAEKLRQLYVALTRAKERVYLPCVVPRIPKDVDKGSASALELFIGGYGLRAYSFQEVYQNIGELSLQKVLSLFASLGPKVSYELLSDTFSCSFFTKKEEKLEAPYPVSFDFKETSLLSFSSISQLLKKEEPSFAVDQVEGDLPGGAETGTVIHNLLESICKAGLHQREDAELNAFIISFLQGTFLVGFEKEVFTLIKHAFTQEIRTAEESLSLQQIPFSDMLIEMEFLYPVGDSFLKGFIDLVFRYQGKYYLLDWKTNTLGSYSRESIAECMESSQYNLQASIYKEALEKYLGLFTCEDSFGGAIYFFLRGGEPFFFFPEKKLEGVLS